MRRWRSCWWRHWWVWTRVLIDTSGTQWQRPVVNLSLCSRSKVKPETCSVLSSMGDTLQIHYTVRTRQHRGFIQLKNNPESVDVCVCVGGGVADVEHTEKVEVNNSVIRGQKMIQMSMWWFNWHRCLCVCERESVHARVCVWPPQLLWRDGPAQHVSSKDSVRVSVSWGCWSCSSKTLGHPRLEQQLTTNSTKHYLGRCF